MNTNVLMGLAAAGVLALSACAPQTVVRTDGTIAPAGSGPSVPAGSCNVTSVGWAVGQQATSENLARIKRESGANQGRVIAPDTVITQDFHADRVNVRIDDNRKILRVTCG